MAHWFTLRYTLYLLFSFTILVPNEFILKQVFIDALRATIPEAPPNMNHTGLSYS